MQMMHLAQFTGAESTKNIQNFSFESQNNSLRTENSSFLDSLKAAEKKLAAGKEEISAAEKNPQGKTESETEKLAAEKSESENSVQKNENAEEKRISSKKEQDESDKTQGEKIPENEKTLLPDENSLAVQKNSPSILEENGKSEILSDNLAEENGSGIKNALSLEKNGKTEKKNLETEKNIQNLLSESEKNVPPEEESLLSSLKNGEILETEEENSVNTGKKLASASGEKAEIKVFDLRTKKIPENSENISVQESEVRKEKVSGKFTEKQTDTMLSDNPENQNSKKKSGFDFAYKQDSSNSITANVEFHGGITQNITSSSAQSAAASSSNFQAMLSNAVQENIPDFVKAGSIILRDNDNGSINLVLHPEKLGNVRINLSLSDKLISGTITVNSREAYEALKENLVSLKNAFAEKGFETGQFDLNFQSQENFAQNQNENSRQREFLAEKNYGQYVSHFENSETGEIFENAAPDGVFENSVDIVA